MPCLVYLDFLRQVTPPGETVLDRDFMIFGGFDALKVDLFASTIQEMKLQYEAGHEQIDAIYDRQPMYLYSPEMNESEIDIFSKDGDNANLPIVISIIQINKSRYAQEPKASSTDLVEHFTNLVEQMVKDENMVASDCKLRYSVFWNLGESDAVIVFRAECLHSVANILHKIRTSKDEIFQVFSTCSHCGFPWQEEKTKTREELIKWLKREEGAHKTGFISFINTSSAFHDLCKICDKPNGIQGAFLFGEWDYSSFQSFEDDSDIEKIADHILLSVYPDDGNPPFKTSYTIPAVELDNPGRTDGKPLHDSGEWINEIKV